MKLGARDRQPHDNFNEFFPVLFSHVRQDYARNLQVHAGSSLSHFFSPPVLRFGTQCEFEIFFFSPSAQDSHDIIIIFIISGGGGGLCKIQFMTFGPIHTSRVRDDVMTRITRACYYYIYGQDAACLYRVREIKLFIVWAGI